jgi:branched-chain amino acid aminotransferase
MTSIRIEPVTGTDPSSLPAELGFGRYFSDRMFSQHYSAAAGWHDASIGPYRPLTLDPAAQVFHNGQMIFDGTKAYRRPDGNINLFRVERNAERFNRSAERMGMPGVPVAAHVEAIETLVALEHRWVPYQPDAALYIRPVMIATEKALAIRAPQEYLHYIILSPVSPYFAGGFAPVAVYVSHEYVRAVRGGTGEAKTPGNYAGSVKATEIAIAQGYQQVLWLDAVERRYVDEVGAMNIAFVYEGKRLRTPALSGAILHGVTRESVLTLAADLGLETSEERIDFLEVLRDIERGHITEIFGMGTGAVIAPVGRLRYQARDIVLNGGEPGPVARRLYDELTGIQFGRLPDRHGWTRQIRAG